MVSMKNYDQYDLSATDDDRFRLLCKHNVLENLFPVSYYVFVDSK